ncbi:MAG: sigma-70 family RNA polymerase sigma factor [Acidobacteria bacterium]|nr:sigma-70 family RNA polymerase sigma factor [Acidobacteriota bacterium]
MLRPTPFPVCFIARELKSNSLKQIGSIFSDRISRKLRYWNRKPSMSAATIPLDTIAHAAEAVDVDALLPEPCPFSRPDKWTVLVDQIKSGDPAGLESLYRYFSRGVRYSFYRQCGRQELEDKVHDTFLIVVQAIMSGEVRVPGRLVGYIRTVVRRQIASHVNIATSGKRDDVDVEPEESILDYHRDPEQAAIRDEQVGIIIEMLAGISDRDREILTRFYIDEDPTDVICNDMGLTRNQFRLLKSRAKARFCEIGRHRLGIRDFSRSSVRTLEDE